VTVVREEKRTVTHKRDGVTVVRHLTVEPASDVPLVTARLLGGIDIVGGVAVRIFPHRDPVYPWATCESVDEEPVDQTENPAGSDAGLAMLDVKNFPEMARLKATYTTPDHKEDQQQQNDEKELASESYDFGARHLTLPSDQMLVYGLPDKLLKGENLAATKTIPTLTAVIVRHYCAQVPFDAIVKLTGRVNKSTVRLISYTYAPEMVRFDGAADSRKLTNKGVPYFELTLKFSVQTAFDFITTPPEPNPLFPDNGKGFVGWNRVYIPKLKYWEYVVWAADQQRRIYLYDEDIQQTIRTTTVKGFSLLFHPAAR
jgi:hypothetical protein